MIKKNFKLLNILTINSLNVKHQGKNLQSIGISPVSVHAFMKTLQSNISKKVQVDCLNNSESDSYDKMTCKRKWMSRLGFTRHCKKNRKQHHIQNQSKFLPWYLINGLECTVQNILIPLNTLFELHMKSKN